MAKKEMGRGILVECIQCGYQFPDMDMCPKCCTDEHLVTSRAVQLKIDLKIKIEKSELVDKFYKACCEVAKGMNIEILDDGYAPYTEDMTEQYLHQLKVDLNEVPHC